MRTKSRPIIPGGKQALFTNLKLDRGGEARSSGEAGDYVCNYSMYVILDYLRRRKLHVPFGFIHIPCLYDSRRAIRFLIKVIRRAMLITQTPQQIKTKS